MTIYKVVALGVAGMVATTAIAVMPPERLMSRESFPWQKVPAVVPNVCVWLPVANVPAVVPNDPA